jgi:RNA polymerase primary sigma factor
MTSTTISSCSAVEGRNRDHRTRRPTADQRTRAQRLLRNEIDFVPNKSFRTQNVEDLETNCDSATPAVPSRSASVVSPPRHNQDRSSRLCEPDRLTADEERELFRRMNYLKYRANALRVTLDPERLDLQALEEAERYLEVATAIRNRIIGANMRLVISVVKKFVTPQLTLDELLSDGILTLMNAVDKFDYDRGFRFSTYAYQSIAHGAYRVIADRQKAAKRVTINSEALVDVESADEDSSMDVRTWELLRGTLGGMIDRLDRREQFIIRGRYALGAHRKAQTFQALGDKLGLSKERPRQLAQRALSKLQQMAADLRIESFM